MIQRGGPLDLRRPRARLADVMQSKSVKRFALIALHLVVPVLIIGWLALSGEKLISGTVPDWTVLKDTRWTKLEADLELREVELNWKRAEKKSHALLKVRLTAVRFSPLIFGAEAAFNPVEGGKSLAEIADEKKVPVVANGGYFGKKNEPVTLLISGGKLLRKPFETLPYSGVFALDVKGKATVRPLKGVKPPYAGIDFAVQNSPLLVYKWKVVLRGKKKPMGRRYRRTAIGVDAKGRVVLLVADTRLNFEELAVILNTHEKLGGFGLRDAVNLDGGPSSGMAVSHEKAKRHVKPGRVIPYVIMVRKRAKSLVPEKKKAPEKPEKPKGEFVPPTALPEAK